MRKTAAYTSTEHKTNKDFAKELNIVPVLDKIQKTLDMTCEQDAS